MSTSRATLRQSAKLPPEAVQHRRPAAGGAEARGELVLVGLLPVAEVLLPQGQLPLAAPAAEMHPPDPGALGAASRLAGQMRVAAQVGVEVSQGLRPGAFLLPRMTAAAVEDAAGPLRLQGEVAEPGGEMLEYARPRGHQ